MNYLKRFLTLALLTLFLFSTQHTALANAPQINLPKIGETSIENNDSILLSDQRTIVSGTRGGELVFIDSKTTQILNKVKVTDNSIYQILEQNKDNILFTTYPSKIWRYTISSGEIQQIHASDSYGGGEILLVKPNQLLIVGSKLSLLNLSTGDLIWSFDIGRSFADWAYNPKEHEIALAFNDGTINIYNLSTPSFQQTIQFETREVDSVLLEYTHDQNQIYVWHRIVTNKYNPYYIPSIFVKHGNHYEKSNTLLQPTSFGTLDTFQISEDNRFMVASEMDTMFFYDLVLEKKIHTMPHIVNQSIRNVEWLTPANKLIVLSRSKIGYLDTTELQKLASLKEIKVDTLQQTLYVGNEYPLHGYFVFSDGTHEPFDVSKLDWHVNDFYKAGLENGKIITREPGKVTFTANYLGHTLSVSKVIHSHKPQDADQYVEQEKATNVPADKVWEVTVNEEISYKNIQQKDIFVTDASGILVPTVYVIDAKASTSKIKIVPAGEYESGKTYTLWIKNLSSSTGQNLDNKVKMDFTIK